MQWFMPLISPLRKQKHKDHHLTFVASLIYIASTMPARATQGGIISKN